MACHYLPHSNLIRHKKNATGTPKSVSAMQPVRVLWPLPRFLASPNNAFIRSSLVLPIKGRAHADYLIETGQTACCSLLETELVASKGQTIPHPVFQPHTHCELICDPNLGQSVFRQAHSRLHNQSIAGQPQPDLWRFANDGHKAGRVQLP
jgi:hypothetical protein